MSISRSPPSPSPPCTPTDFGLSATFFPFPPNLNPNPTASRRALLRRNSSWSSLGSEMEVVEEEREWTVEEVGALKRTIDHQLPLILLHSSPFQGALPTQLIHQLADHYLTLLPSPSPSSSHSLRSIRSKISELVSMPSTPLDGSFDIEQTPRAVEMDATPKVKRAAGRDGEGGKKRVKLIRVGSMDFLPEPASYDEGVSTAARLGSRLQSSTSSVSPSLTSPTPFAYSPYPLQSHSYKRPSLHRTTSLSSIPGSPSQPVTKNEKRPSLLGVMGTGHAMGRTGSDNGFGMASRPLSFGIGIGKEKDETGLLTPPSSTEKKVRSKKLDLGLPLSVGVGLGGMGGGGGGLGSAFRTPVENSFSFESHNDGNGLSEDDYFFSKKGGKKMDKDGGGLMEGLTLGE